MTFLPKNQPAKARYMRGEREIQASSEKAGKTIEIILTSGALLTGLCAITTALIILVPKLAR